MVRWCEEPVVSKLHAFVDKWVSEGLDPRVKVAELVRDLLLLGISDANEKKAKGALKSDIDARYPTFLASLKPVRAKSVKISDDATLDQVLQEQLLAKIGKEADKAAKKVVDAKAAASPPKASQPSPNPSGTPPGPSGVVSNYSTFGAPVASTKSSRADAKTRAFAKAALPFLTTTEEDEPQDVDAEALDIDDSDFDLTEFFGLDEDAHDDGAKAGGGPSGASSSCSGGGSSTDSLMLPLASAPTSTSGGWHEILDDDRESVIFDIPPTLSRDPQHKPSLQLEDEWTVSMECWKVHPLSAYNLARNSLLLEGNCLPPAHEAIEHIQPLRLTHRFKRPVLTDPKYYKIIQDPPRKDAPPRYIGIVCDYVPTKIKKAKISF